MEESPLPRRRPRETTLRLNVVAPRRCACVGSRRCKHKKRTCLRPVTYCGRGQPPRCCEICRFNGAAKAAYRENKTDDDRKRSSRVSKSKSRAAESLPVINRRIQRVCGPGIPEAHVFQRRWSKEELPDLHILLDDVIRQCIARNEVVRAAPFFCVRNEALFLDAQRSAATKVVEQALDYLIEWARKKSAPRECEHWKEHFLILKARTRLMEYPLDRDEIMKNIRVLDGVAKRTDSAFVRSMAAVEMFGQHVALRNSEAERRFKELCELGLSYSAAAPDWVLGIARLRPIVQYGVNTGRRGFVKQQLDAYRRTACGKRTLRQVTVIADWQADLGEAISLDTSKLRYRPYIPPINPTFWASCEALRPAICTLSSYRVP
jgi:hypothetical protein